MFKGVRFYCCFYSFYILVIKDCDYYLKIYKLVFFGSKLVDWLLVQGDCQIWEEVVVFGVGLCNNGFMYYVLEKSEFRDEFQYFCFYVDEEMEGISSKNKQFCNDFKLVENILVKCLLILFQEEDYGFDIEEKNKVVVVKIVQRGLLVEMVGLQVGRKIYFINEDLVFLWFFLEVEFIFNQFFCFCCFLCFLVVIKVKEIIKIFDQLDILCFQIYGVVLLYVYVVGRGFEVMVVGFCVGQCILKVNGSNVMNDGVFEVLDYFQVFWSWCEEVLGLYQWIYYIYEDVQEV